MNKVPREKKDILVIMEKNAPATDLNNKKFLATGVKGLLKEFKTRIFL